MKTIEQYRAAARAYTVIVSPGSEDPFEARAADFPAAIGAGDTPAEAADALIEAIAAGLEHAEADGFVAPPPMRPDARATSIELPATLYRQLAARAAAEGVSLNTAIVYLLARSLGEEQPTAGW